MSTGHNTCRCELCRGIHHEPAGADRWIPHPLIVAWWLLAVALIAWWWLT